MSSLTLKKESVSEIRIPPINYLSLFPDENGIYKIKDENGNVYKLIDYVLNGSSMNNGVVWWNESLNSGAGGFETKDSGLDFFKIGGNSNGEKLALGTKDDFDLEFKTNDSKRGSFTKEGDFEIGTSKFLVNASGNIIKINNITYSWPDSQASSPGLFLKNDGSGVLTWDVGGGGGFTPTNLLTDYGFTDNSSDWDDAYSWGDHSSQGYLDSTTASNTYTPLSRKITINSTEYDLSSDRSWTIAMTPAGLDKSIQFNNNGALSGNGDLVWDYTNSRLGVGTDTPYATFTVVSQGTSNVRSIVGEHYDNSTAFSQFKFIGGRGRGSKISPSAVLIDDSLVSFNARGYKTDTWSDTVGGFYVYAAENWNNSATGTYTTIRGVNVGGTAVSEWLRIDQSGILVNNITNATVDTDKFLVSDNGRIKYRTGVELLSDLGISGGYLATSGGTMTGNILFDSGYGIDTTSTGGSDVLNIGATNADIINIGRNGITVNILGSTVNWQATNSYVNDVLITLNKGGGVGTAIGSGIEFEENNIITGYIKTGSSRNSFLFLTPAVNYYSEFTFSTLTDNRAYTLPNASGTIALTSDLINYQPIDGDLTAIAVLTGTNGLLRKDALDTWSLDTNVYLTGNQTIILSGDISGTGSTTITTTIGPNKVTNGMIRQSAGLSVIGRGANSNGDVADITAGSADQVLRRSGTTLGFGTVATGGITNAAITYVKIQNVAANRFLANVTGSAATVQEISTGRIPLFSSDITGTPSASTFLRGDGSWNTVSASPGGSTTHVQYNGSGSFEGSADLTWDNSNKKLTIGNTTGNVDIAQSDSYIIGYKINNIWMVRYHDTSKNFLLANNTNLSSISSAQNNIFFGNNIGNAITTGNRNIGIGIGSNTPLSLLTSGSDNISIGNNSGSKITSGDTNIFIGNQAAKDLQGQATSNIVIGHSAYKVALHSSNLFSLVIGNYAYENYVGVTEKINTIIGNYAANASSTSGNLTVIGHSAIRNALAVDNSVYIGEYAGFGVHGNTNINNNTVVGYAAMGDHNDQGNGTDNTAIGSNAGRGNRNASGNVYVGSGTGTTVTSNLGRLTGGNNTFIGTRSANSALISGNHNIAIGYESMASAGTSGAGNLSGSFSIAIGVGAMRFANGTAANHIAIGSEALRNVTTTGFGTHNNIAIGNSASRELTTGLLNVCVGHDAGRFITTGNRNLVFGSGTGYGMESSSAGNIVFGDIWTSGYASGSGTSLGSYNIYISPQNGALKPTGDYNISLGVQVMGGSNTVTHNNTIYIGREAGRHNFNSEGNIAIGFRAINGNSTTTLNQHNIAIGHQAMGGASFIGNRNIFIGYQAGLNATSVNDTLIIANGSTTSNELILGDFANLKTQINGSLGVGVTLANTNACLHIKAGTATVNTAPIRINNGVKETSARTGLIEFENNFYFTNNATLRYSIGGSIFQKISSVGTPNNTTETDLFTDTLVANTLAVNGDSINATYGFTLTNNAPTKRIRLYFAGTVIYDTGVLTSNASGSVSIQVQIMRITSTSVRYMVIAGSSGTTTLPNSSSVGELTGLTLSSTNIIKVSGQIGGTPSTNDITAIMSKIAFEAAV
jgi:hypothetical protein